jgi:ribosome-associated protein
MHPLASTTGGGCALEQAPDDFHGFRRGWMGLVTPEAPDPASGMIRITSEVSIHPDELRYRFSRSGGPGGQHVNRSETRVELLFDIANSPSLTESQRRTVLHRLGGQVDASGVLRIVSSATRSQLENREDALRRLQALLAGALKEHKRRVATHPTRSARERRLAEKRLRGSVKSGRRFSTSSDAE